MIGKWRIPMKKKLWICAILTLITICSVTIGAAAAQPPSAAQQNRLDAVYVNGTELKSYLAQHPGMGYVYIDNNVRTMVPMRAIADLLGLEIQFRSADQAIVIDGGTKGQVVFYLNSTAYSVGGVRYTMDTTPVFINGRTHVPIRFLVESLGGVVYYTPKSGYYNGVAEIYYHANDVTPTAPSWANGDYVTFERTSAYTPENWAVITDLRERAAQGEDVTKDLDAFHKNFICAGSGIRTLDQGIQYELLLIDVENKLHGYDKSSGAFGTVSLQGVTYTEEQQNSITRWELRGMGAADKIGKIYLRLYEIYYQNLYGVDGNNDNGIRSYDPACTKVLGVSLPDFFAESWFDGIDYCPAPIYFDNDCPTGSPAASSSDDYPARWWMESVYTENGVTRVDLELVGSGLSLKRGVDDYHLTSPQVAWAKENRNSSGELTAVEMDWNGTIIRVSRDSSVVRVGNRSVSLGSKVVAHTDPTSKKTHLYVPMSFLTDVLGETVTYDEASGIWFVSRTHQVSNPTLERWALAMCAVMSRRGDGNPYYLGMYNRCMRMQTQFVPSPANPERLMRYYSFFPANNIAKAQLEKSWGCTSANDIRTQAQLLTTSPNPQYPAWDLFRVAHIASWGYAAGYLTADEALGLIEPAAQKLQKDYVCWDDAYADWINGYRVVFGGDTEECSLRQQIYTSLKEEQTMRGILFDNSLFTTSLK